MTSNRPDVVEILAPTFFEYLLARSVRPDVRVRHVGMRMSRWRDENASEAVILCGLAGSLTPDLRPGDVVIPDEYSFEGDGVRTVDPLLASALRQAARSLGCMPHAGRLLTAPRLVTGDGRNHWAEKGFIAADMESALIPERLRFAVIRVILDAPGRSISSEWTSPFSAIVDPQRWREMLWMARYAPWFARRAAVIAGAAARLVADPESN